MDRPWLLNHEVWEVVGMKANERLDGTVDDDLRVEVDVRELGGRWR